MGMKNKGFFFTMDSILAGGIILVVILLSSSSYVNKQPSVHLNYLSQDLVRTLSAITVEEIDNEYLNARIASGDITNPDNTVLEQISEFWADGEMEFASNSVLSVIEPILPNSVGFGVWIDDELVYQRDVPLTKSLVSSKIIVSGVETTLETRKYPPTSFGPVVFEVRVWQ